MLTMTWRGVTVEPRSTCSRQRTTRSYPASKFWWWLELASIRDFLKNHWLDICTMISVNDAWFYDLISKNEKWFRFSAYISMQWTQYLPLKSAKISLWFWFLLRIIWFIVWPAQHWRLTDYLSIYFSSENWWLIKLWFPNEMRRCDRVSYTARI